MFLIRAVLLSITLALPLEALSIKSNLTIVSTPASWSCTSITNCLQLGGQIKDSDKCECPQIFCNYVPSSSSTESSSPPTSSSSTESSSTPTSSSSTESSSTPTSSSSTESSSTPTSSSSIESSSTTTISSSSSSSSSPSPTPSYLPPNTEPTSSSSPLPPTPSPSPYYEDDYETENETNGPRKKARESEECEEFDCVQNAEECQGEARNDQCSPSYQKCCWWM